MLQTIEQNPLLVAGVGLLLGGLIASALPRSEIEDNLVGEASEAAKSRARDAASRGFDAAKGAAEEIIENVARQAGAEGLTSGGLDEAAKDIGQRVRRVAEAAVTTAFDPDNELRHPLPAEETIMAEISGKAEHGSTSGQGTARAKFGEAANSTRVFRRTKPCRRGQEHRESEDLRELGMRLKVQVSHFTLAKMWRRKQPTN